MYTSYYKRLMGAFVGTLVNSTLIFAQETPAVVDNTAALKTFEAQQTQIAASQKAEAIVKATKQGLPIRYQDKSGKLVELVRFENDIPIYLTSLNSVSAATISANKVFPGGGAGLNLTGSGVTLSEWDEAAVRGTHQELTGRVTQVDGVTTLSNHATHVAGTIIGSGVVPAAKGFSYQGNLHAHDWNNNVAEITATSTRASNHSYGQITGWRYNSTAARWEWFGNPTISTVEDYRFGFYDPIARDWDALLFNKPSHVAVKAAGNDRGEGPAAGTLHYYISGGGWVSSTATRNLDGNAAGYNSIIDAGNGKNVLTVGAVNDIPAGYAGPASVVMSSFSGWGPTDDGRIKPDVVANGVGLTSSVSTSNTAYGSYTGTSMATPSVTGSIGLLLHHERNLYGYNSFRSSTVKGLLIHTADEAGTAPGPDYRFGWGLVNVASAAKVISDHASFCRHIKEFNLQSGNAIDLLVNKVAGQNLKVTIVWTDPAGVSPAASLNPIAKRLINDLDVRVTNIATAGISYPYILGGLANPAAAASVGDNNTDNVEQVLVTATAGGTYRVRISHKGVLSGGNQIVSVIITGNDGVVNTLNLSGINLASGVYKSYHYNAINTTTFTAQSGSTVYFRATKKITFSPGTRFNAGSYVSAWVSGTCALASNARTEEVAEPETKSSDSFTDEVGSYLAEEEAFAYPNPVSSGYLYFSKVAANYELVNAAGTKILAGKDANKISVDGLVKGLYVLKLDGKVQKVVVE